jgi:hypothetical protein
MVGGTSVWTDVVGWGCVGEKEDGGTGGRGTGAGREGVEGRGLEEGLDENLVREQSQMEVAVDKRSAGRLTSLRIPRSGPMI